MFKLLHSIAFLALLPSVRTYNLIDLGENVKPTDVNNQGTIVGSCQKEAGQEVAFYWDGGSLQEIRGGQEATAVNDAHQVAGATNTGCFLLLDDDSWQEWTDYTHCHGLNKAGQMVGSRKLVNPHRRKPIPLDPALYTPSTSWQSLGKARTYRRGRRQGVYADLYKLVDMNDAGFCVGLYRKYGIVGARPILMTPAFDNVTFLPFEGNAYAVNNHNLVVGNTHGHACLYDYNKDVLVDLGTLGLKSSAADINDKNQVVGASQNTHHDSHAFLWEQDNMIDLNDLISMDESGWILTKATAINDRGDIVGVGLKDEREHGFLLTVESESDDKYDVKTHRGG